MDKLNLAHYFELRSVMTSITSSLVSIRVICKMQAFVCFRVDLLAQGTSLVMIQNFKSIELEIGGPKSGVSRRLSSSHLQQRYALPCYTAIKSLFILTIGVITDSCRRMARCWQLADVCCACHVEWTFR